MSAPPIVKLRVVLVILVHAVLVAVAWFGALWLRVDGQEIKNALAKGHDYWGRFLQLFGLVFAARMISLARYGLFQGLWRYVSITDLINLVKATALGTAVYAAWLVYTRFDLVPLSIVIIEPMLCLMLLGGVRFAIRMYRESFAPSQQGARRVIIAGAGDAGEMLLREMKAHRHLGYDPVGFVDDDATKWGRRIHGVTVLGSVDDLKEFVARTMAEEVIVAAPTGGGDVFRRVLTLTAGTGVRLRRLPSKSSDIVRLTSVRSVDFEDLLDRDPVAIDLESLRAAVRGKTVLVTGAGGSIGSEVVRQLAPLEPALIVALDRSENALFFLEREMAVHHSMVKVKIRIGDCNDRSSMRTLFAETMPYLVIHAAAFKHVPLMEAHPVEAVLNNVAATRFLAELAQSSGVQKFLLISSDKAVNPTSVMGATKRAAELALQTVQHSTPGSGTQFVAVRFGNVLGSEGSVVPLFRRQIREGGPVTVTHKDVVRYFMTIPEAVGLVLQAGVMGQGGELFHLDMGSPVKVSELAEKLILLEGFRPNEDIEIRYTGLRPGEKMSEELLAEGEGVEKTAHPRILVVRRGDVDRAALGAQLDALLVAASHGRERLILSLKALVPEYEPQNDEFRRLLAENPQALPGPNGGSGVGGASGTKPGNASPRKS